MASYSLPPQYNRFLLLIGTLFFTLCCCQANKVNLTEYACAKNGVQVQKGLKAGDDGSTIAITNEIGNEVMFYARRTGATGHKKLIFRISVEGNCTDIFKRIVSFSKDCTTHGPKECPAEDKGNLPKGCVSFSTTCKADARIVKINLKNLDRLKEQCKWKGHIDHFRLLVLDKNDSNGEPCEGGLETWIIVSMIVAGVILLLAVAVGIFVFVFLRRRPQSQAPGMGTSSYFWSLFQKKPAGGSVAPSTGTKAGVLVGPSTGTGGEGKLKTSYGAMGATAAKTTTATKAGDYTNYTKANIPTVMGTTIATTAKPKATMPIGSKAAGATAAKTTTAATKAGGDYTNYTKANIPTVMGKTIATTAKPKTSKAV